MGSRICIVENSYTVSKLLRKTLLANGFFVDNILFKQDASEQISHIRPDLIILDLESPDMYGIQFLSEIRQWSTVPIIILSDCNDENFKVNMLDHGADDYVVKPFGTREVVARIRVALRRRSHPCEDPVLKLGPIAINLACRGVMRNEEPIYLTPIEYEMLKLLAVHAGRVLTHRQITEQLWSEEPHDKADQYLRIYVGRLRKKIESDPTHPKILTTEPGVGYRLLVPQ